jgi:transposase
MGKRLVIEPHLSVEELQNHYRRAADPIERTRYQIIWLLAKGLVTEEVVSVTGYHPDRIRRIARRYNQSGPQGLIDGRRSHPGRTPMLSDIEQAHLWQALNSLAEDGGLGNGHKVADWVAQFKGKPIHRQRGWEYLRQMNFRQLVPLSQHDEADIEQQQEWKKTKLGTGAAASKVCRS